MEIILHHGDGERAIKDAPDNNWSIGIVDPPYFSGPERRQFYGNNISATGVRRREYNKIPKWSCPPAWYFRELERVTKNQIVWGCNYYDYNFGPGRIVWDKCNGKSSFSDCELAYTSFHDSTRLFRYMWNGMMQGKSISDGHIMQGDKSKNEKRIHQTQKPVNLYKWLLSQYAKPGDTIVDSHLGSASIGIACIDMGFDLEAWEAVDFIYDAAAARIAQHKHSNIFA